MCWDDQEGVTDLKDEDQIRLRTNYKKNCVLCEIGRCFKNFTGLGIQTRDLLVKHAGAANGKKSHNTYMVGTVLWNRGLLWPLFVC